MKWAIAVVAIAVAIIILVVMNQGLSKPQAFPANQQAIQSQQITQECQENQVQNCTKNGCPGTQRCYRGRWGSCILPKRICSPGEKIGCNYDGCKFGYAECNECGTAFGPCVLRQEANCS
ncbi:MAG: hypothetical protein QXN37_04115 [Candidatus Anstonellaceae archaeon]